MNNRTTKSVRKDSFVSDHITFNKLVKTFGISTGNVVSPVQFSNFVRSYDDTECNKQTFEQGRLRSYDLFMFKNYKIPISIVNWLHENKEKKVILYCLRHLDRNTPIIHGWIITDTNYYGPKLLKQWTNGRQKSISIVTEVIKFITNH